VQPLVPQKAANVLPYKGCEGVMLLELKVLQAVAAQLSLLLLQPLSCCMLLPKMNTELLLLPLAIQID